MQMTMLNVFKNVSPVEDVGKKYVLKMIMPGKKKVITFIVTYMADVGHYYIIFYYIISLKLLLLLY